MKILLTGSNGFLGYYLSVQLVNAGHTLVATGRRPLPPFISSPLFQYEIMDLSMPETLNEIIHRHQPDMIVHAGAMTKPDDCEQEQELAWRTNVTATENLLNASAAMNSRFLYVSTDFIFDGRQGPYRETDIPSPVNYYGLTKLNAEQLVMQYPGHWAIARTVSLYGKPFFPRPYLMGIVKERLENNLPYKVVDDQWRTPTYVEDLAKGLTLMVQQEASGIFHLAGPDYMTAYDMAIRTAEYLGLNTSLLQRVNADTFVEVAKRPLRTGFLIDKAKAALGFNPLSFEEGLRRTFNR